MNRFIRTVSPAACKEPDWRSGIVFFRSFLAAGLLFLGAVFANAQTAGNPERLSPDMAVDMAIKNNLNLEVARTALDIKERKSRLVWNEFLPSVSAYGVLSGNNWAAESPGLNIPGVISTPATTLPKWGLMGAVNANLTFSFALIEGIKSFRLDYKAGLVSYEKARLQIEQGIRKMYNQILLVEANAALLMDSYNNASKQAEMAEANFNAGLAPRLTWLQAQVAVENMRPSINELDNNLKALKGNFAILLGLSYDTPLLLEPIAAGTSIIPSDVAMLIAKAANEKPDIQELQASIITLNSQRKALAIQGYTPFLRFDWTMSSVFTGDPWKDSWFKSDNWNHNGQAGGSFSVTLGISLNSLLPFTKEGQQRKDMEANVQIQNILLAQKVRETELEVFSIINSLEKTRTGEETQQAAVDLAQLSYNLTEEAYRAGLQDFQSVQNAALALDQAKLQLLTQQFSYLNDLIDLEYAIGVPFGTLSKENN